MGWHAADDSWWPVIAEALTGKWSREAALMDLRWYGDRRNYTGQAMPGRRVLSKRWSWKPGAVRWLLASDEWADPRWEEQPSNSPPTARLQPGNDPPTAQEQPAEGSSKADNEDVSSPPTARLQPGNDPPTTRLQPNNSPPFRDTTHSQAHPPTQTPLEAEVSPATTALHLPGMGGPVQDAPAPAGPPAPIAAAGKRTKTGVDPQLFARIAKLWAHEAFLSKGNRTTRAPQLKFKTSEGTKAILAMLKAGVTEDDFGKLFKRHWLGPDDFNRRNGNGLKTIAKFHERYLERALDEESGAVVKPSTAQRTGANAHNFGAPPTPREPDWIELEVVDNQPTQGGHRGR